MICVSEAHSEIPVDMESVILHRETSAVDGVWKPRRAHYGDVEELLKLHLSCFDEEDHLMVLLGRGFLKAAYRWMIPWPSTSSRTGTKSSATASRTKSHEAS